ncbi:glycosyltransferase [bacterium]|nr:glycosyltransferase [bacterium]
MIALSVILVNYNVKRYLEQALLSIRKALEGISSEVIVVDNASSDGSVSMLRARFPDVILIENRENAGFARANNQALKRASGKTVCLINPDTLVREDTFSKCLDYLARHPETGMVGCKILNPDGSLQLACRRSFPTPWVAFTKVTGLSALFPKTRLFGKYNLTYLNPDQEAQVDAISGSFMMARRKAVDEAGFLDEDFFMYGEDLDWCYRFVQKGWKISYIPDTQIIHYKGRSTQEASFDGIRLFYQAMSLFVAKHFPRGWSIIPRRLLMAGIWLRGGFSFFSRLAARFAPALVDLAFMQASLIAALLIRFGHLIHWHSYRLVDLVYTLIWLASLAAVGVYRRRVYSFSRAVAGVMLGLMANTSITFFFNQYAYSRHVVLVEGLLNLILLGGWRLAVRMASRLPGLPFLGKIGRTLLRKRVVIIGAGPSARRIYLQLRNQIDTLYDVIGLIGISPADLADAPSGREAPVLGALDDLKRIVRSHRVQEAVIAPEALTYERIVGLMTLGKELGLDFRIVARDLDVVIGSASVDAIEDVPLLDLEYRIFYGLNPFLKRIFDLAISGLILCLAFPIFLWAALHPGIEARKTLLSDGSGGCLEVKTWERKGKPLAGWIRGLPAVGSVLRGGMSLVGTEWTPCGEGVRGAGFKPGLTGLVQVSGSRKLSQAEKEKFNLYYLKNYSFLLDLEILIKALFLL